MRWFLLFWAFAIGFAFVEQRESVRPLHPTDHTRTPISESPIGQPAGSPVRRA